MSYLKIRDLALITGWLGIILIQLKYYLQGYTFVKKRTSQGISMNYLLLNFTGYFLLAICYTIKYISQSKGVEMTEVSDLVMVYHGSVIVLILIFLCKKFSYFVNPLTFSGIFSALTLLLGSFFYFLLKKYYFYNQITVFELLGFQMFVSNIFKYLNQIKHMYDTKCVKGLNENFLYLDFYGCLLLFIQYSLDYYGFVYESSKRQHSFVINYVKLVLLVSSLINNSIAIYFQKKYSNYQSFDNIIQNNKIKL